MKRLQMDLTPTLTPPHTHMDPLQGNPNKNHHPCHPQATLSISVTSVMQSPAMSPPVPAPPFAKTLKRSSSNVFFPAPCPYPLPVVATLLDPQEHADVQSNLPKEKKRLSPVRLKAERGSQASLCIFRHWDVSWDMGEGGWFEGPRATRKEWWEAKKKINK